MADDHARPIPEFGREHDRAVAARPSPTKRLLALSLPALLIGIGSALGLIVLDVAALALEDLLWEVLPDASGIDPDSAGWIIGILTGAGLATGLIVRFTPGHAGPDPATETFFPPPLPLSTLPGLAAAAILTLATGVSLGPEAPIIAINVALAVWVCRRVVPKIPTKLVVLMVVTGTFGALFGSPVGAALLVTSVAATVASKELLWDRLFAPLVSAAAGSIVMLMSDHSSLAIPLPDFELDILRDLGFALVVVAVAIIAGLGLLYAFPVAHRIFHRWRDPILPLTVAGLMLGVLGAIGGPITLFKGLDQMAQLAESADDYTAGQLAVIVLVKLAALMIAGAAGFRGGRVFPAVFIGAAIGILAYTVFPDIPLTIAISAGVLGVCLVVIRDGWLSLFIAAVVAGDATMVPILCMVVLPGWLAVARLPEMRITPPGGHDEPEQAPVKPA
ncbi:ion channel protein [Microbacterium aquimaris]|uniref:ion channel protein n=1 Tax=Microbacterium aquimaris TaxID=459816 RepID=UPI002AD55213|nr:ion channel protein [Microbacterium aquimaris]MDZ8274607.1 ion channel protein [Microbacterium aquimaris]